MRTAILIAFACLVFSHSPAAADFLFFKSRPKPQTFVAYVPQTARVKMECFPDDLQDILRSLGSTFGRPVVVTSGHRNTRTTRRRSRHRTCTAADIRIPGVSSGKIATAARNDPRVGGVGTYCGSRNGLVHVDVGPRRNWNYCGRRSKRR